MSYNGSGTFNINTSGQPVVTGTTISTTAFNALTADLATGLTNAITRDGQSPATANIPMGGNKITGLAAGTTSGDSLRFEQVLSTTTSETTLPFIASGTGAVATTVQAKLREIVSVKDFGAIGNGSTNDYAAVQAAITAVTAAGGGIVFFPAGTYLCNSQLVIADAAKVTLAGTNRASVIKKGFNGALISLGSECWIDGVYIDGNGGTYTGTGVSITTGALDNVSWRRITNTDILNTASYCVEFSGNRAGYASMLENCRLVPTSTATYSIKAAGNGGTTESNGNRMFRNIWTFGNRIADLTDANDCDFVACHGFFPLFTTTTNKCNFTGGRLNLYDATDQFTGTANVVDGVTMNANGGALLTILSSATNCRFAPSIAVGSGITVTDNSGSASSGNEVWLPQVAYTPTWGGTGGTPTIGNGALGAVCTRRGTAARVNILLNIGSTTAFNTATGWTFTVPYTASRTSTGSAYILDSGTSHYIGIAKIDSGTNTLSVFRDAAGLGVGYLIPMTWAANDLLRVDIEYGIQ
jgi:Pectate lyase superfamily protein